MHAGAVPTAAASRGNLPGSGAASGTVVAPPAGTAAARPPGPAAIDTRVLDGTLRCIARWGIAKTTLDDIAREAGCSRASVYRAFPGGKDALLQSLLGREVASLFGAVDRRLAAATDLEDAVVGGMTVAGRVVTGHPALQFVLAYEPELILPHLAFSNMDRVLGTAAAAVAPRLAGWLNAGDAERAAEWLCRLVVSYLICPSSEVDLSDEESVRHLARRFVLPALSSQEGPR